jgi:hypothetical protein
MPPQQTLLANINSNRDNKGSKLSPYQKGLVVSVYKSDKAPKKIEDKFKLLQKTVRYTLKSI